MSADRLNLTATNAEYWQYLQNKDGGRKMTLLHCQVPSGRRFKSRLQNFLGGAIIYER